MKDAIIISDIHLGSDICNAKLLNKFLDNIESRTKKLILNGDVFDSIDFRRLKKHHWNILSKIRKISDKLEIIWIRGNHDGDAETISHLLGITVVDEYILNEIIIIHGDIFDDLISNHPRLTKLADLFYRFFQKINHNFALIIKHNSKHYSRSIEKVKDKAKKYCKIKNAKYIIVGHTHKPEISENYYNCGSWTEKKCSYISIKDNNISLDFFDENST